MLDKALYLKNKVKDYAEAEGVFREALGKTVDASKIMENLFETMLMNIEKDNVDAVKEDVKTCKKLVDEGADWDKKNKLKSFEGAYCMMIRDLPRAADLFLSSVATFTCMELMDY